MSILRIPLMILVYFSIATISAEAGLLAALAMKGGLDQQRLLQLMAVAYDVDLYAMWKEMEAASRPIKEAQVSHAEVTRERRELSLDLDLREIAAEKGLRDMQQLRSRLESRKDRYKQVHDDFKIRQAEAEKGALDERLRAVQLKLQSMQARQAKDQIIRILDDPELDSQTSLQNVVTIIKAVPLDKRKKILAEFKSKNDAERLHEILRRIRLGVPEVQLIRDTRDQLEQFKNRQ